MAELGLHEQVNVAKAIATIVHRGQLDKGGEPYIGHPQRVAESFRGQDGCAPMMVIAWLHDVLEDSDLTRDDLHAAGIGWSQIADVERLTKVKGESNEDYYQRVRGSGMARRVKLADIADNTLPERLAALDDATVARLIRKYAKAKMWLEFREPADEASPDLETTDGD